MLAARGWRVCVTRSNVYSAPQISQRNTPPITQSRRDMSSISDFNEAELWTIQSTLKERYKRDLAVEVAETELRLNRHTTDMVPCPCLYWQSEDGCHFLIVKTGAERYRSQFFYRVHQMYGTGIEEYDNLTECVVTLLQVQADYASGQHAPGA